MRTTEEWIQVCKEVDAFWHHDGHPERPHALLTSGKCSDGFFNGSIVGQNPVMLDQIAADLTEKMRRQYIDLAQIDYVIGPAMGAITLAHDLARHISIGDPVPCLTAYAEKADGGNAMLLKRVEILKSDDVLLAEDVVTTGGSIGLVAQAVEEAGGKVLPYVVTILNRSGLAEVGGRRIIPLIECEIHSWVENECPLCKLGSKPIRPKEAGNWKLLNAEYSIGN